MDVAEFDRIASALNGVTQKKQRGHVTVALPGQAGRTTARRDARGHPDRLRAATGVADSLLRNRSRARQSSVGHMMVVAELESGDDGAFEDALMAAWALQASHA
jgi:hypothetical protein